MLAPLYSFHLNGQAIADIVQWLRESNFPRESTWSTCLRRNRQGKQHETKSITSKQVLVKDEWVDSDPKACEFIILTKCHAWKERDDTGPFYRLMARGSLGHDQWREEREKDTKPQRATVIRKLKVHRARDQEDGVGRSPPLFPHP